MNVDHVIKIETREHLISTLGEAAELEHSLMCMYLFSVFSLKTSTSENLTEEELELVKKWRKAILAICIQEMGHLALVCNITTAVGGSAHFTRADFPVRSGLFPEDFVLELSRFDQQTLEHFIFLERPENHEMSDSDAFLPPKQVDRDSKPGRLMTYIGNYSTVGELYGAVEAGIEYLSSRLGEANLFCGDKFLQLTDADVKLEGLTNIQSKAQALKALQLIIEQGEGSRGPTDSHFDKFCEIKNEYERALKKNKDFEPSRRVARNPVMRKPVEPKNKVWIDTDQASKMLDLANAIYTLMLRFLLQVYSMENRSKGDRKVMVDSAFSLMHLVGRVASELTLLPASEKAPGENAGISFDLNRHLSSLELSSEKHVLFERLSEIAEAVERLSPSKLDSVAVKLREIAVALKGTR